MHHCGLAVHERSQAGKMFLSLFDSEYNKVVLKQRLRRYEELYVRKTIQRLY